MAQAIADYIKFLTEARVAVDGLNCDQNTRNQQAAQEKRLERELEAAKKAAADAVSQTVKRRRDDISQSYDQEIGIGQERLRKARAQREKEKNRGMKERIADETSGLKEENRQLCLKLRALFDQGRVPRLCSTTLYYALYYPRGLKELSILFMSILICFLGIPCLVYFLLPGHKVWYLIGIYFADVLLFGGLYVTVGNRTRLPFQSTLKEGRQIRNAIRANEKRIKAIVRAIEKDGNEDVYDLEKFDDEISRVEQELAQVAAKKKEALNAFETVTKNIISDEIMAGSREEIEGLEEKLKETQESVKELDARLREARIRIADTYGPYLGQEFLQADKLNELARLIQSGTASNITEAIEAYNKK